MKKTKELIPAKKMGEITTQNQVNNLKRVSDIHTSIAITVCSGLIISNSSLKKESTHFNL